VYATAGVVRPLVASEAGIRVADLLP